MYYGNTPLLPGEFHEPDTIEKSNESFYLEVNAGLIILQFFPGHFFVQKFQTICRFYLFKLILPL